MLRNHFNLAYKNIRERLSRLGFHPAWRSGSGTLRRLRYLFRIRRQVQDPLREVLHQVVNDVLVPDTADDASRLVHGHFQPANVRAAGKLLADADGQRRDPDQQDQCRQPAAETTGTESRGRQRDVPACQRLCREAPRGTRQRPYQAENRPEICPGHQVRGADPRRPEETRGTSITQNPKE